MKYSVVLINPPVPDNKTWVREGRCQQWDIWGAPFPPFSLALIATQLKKIKVKPYIIDSGPEKKDLDATLAFCLHLKPQLAIISTSTPTIETDLGWFLSRLKKCLPYIKVAIIGIHPSALPKNVLIKYPLVDYIIIGEPEITSQKLVSSLVESKPLSSVLGLAWRSGKSIKINHLRPFIQNIDELGFPDWSLINFHHYLLPIKNRPFSLISFSRGCPFNCQFCTAHVYNGKKLRQRSVDSLISEINYNLLLGVKDFLFWTELMTLNRNYLNHFLDKLIDTGLSDKISWVCNSRVDTADFELFKKMKSCGCWQIAFGFEFGNEQILKDSSKGGQATLLQAQKTAFEADKAGLFVDGHFIMGYPTENCQTLQQTIDFASSLPLTFAHFYAAVPFPGSELYRQSLKHHWLDLSAGVYSQDTYTLKTKDLNPDLVNSFISRAYKKFYLRPRIIFKLLSLPQSPSEMFNFLRLSFRFINDLIFPK